MSVIGETEYPRNNRCFRAETNAKSHVNPLTTETNYTCINFGCQVRHLRLVQFSSKINFCPSYRRILTVVPQNDWKRPTGRPHASWLATMKNNLSFHTPVWKMPPSWHWTGYSGGYWQQAELWTEVVQAKQW